MTEGIVQTITDIFRPKKKFEHVMIDIETLGTSPGSVILSLGAVKFNPVVSQVQSREEIAQNSFYAVLDLHTSITTGFTIDASTLNWWMKQSREAQLEAFSKEGSVDFVGTFGEFIEWFDGNEKVWGNGANFDVVLVEEYLRLLKLSIPWKYQNIRCFRTTKNQQSYNKELVPPCQLAHHALEDAIYQAQVMQAICISNPELKIC